MVLRTVKTFASGKVQFTSAIRAEYQAGKHSLPLCLCGAAFICSSFMYPFKDRLLNDCFMCIAENSLLFLCGGNTLFQLVGFGKAFEVYRMSAVVHKLQNCYNRTFIQNVRIIGK